MQPRIDRWITAVVADTQGQIFELEGYAATGMSGQELVPLTHSDTRNMPFGSELMFLPQRRPILYHIRNKRFEILEFDPHRPSERIFPVAAFNSPGYVASRLSAFEETSGAGRLPLFCYGAVGWVQERFRSAVIQVDRERRQDLRLMKEEDVYRGVKQMRRQIPHNRLRQHLEKCALTYGCPAAKNFFLGRYEAPLPTAEACNARCLGCLSLQTDPQISCSQERIGFRPTPEEIAEVALIHIHRVKRAIVSFGQGCEGDPLLAADVIEPAIRIIREQTHEGTIHMNTNGSLPGILERVLAAGLDSIRISVNSLRRECYNAYFQPKGYSFDDVLGSMRLAARQGRHVAINYLNMPGFTDTAEERDSLVSVLAEGSVRMIQWRNMNFDPLAYWRVMNAAAASGKPMGMRRLLKSVQQMFPQITFGYFNPPKEVF